MYTLCFESQVTQHYLPSPQIGKGEEITRTEGEGIVGETTDRAAAGDIGR